MIDRRQTCTDRLLATQTRADICIPRCWRWRSRGTNRSSIDYSSLRARSNSTRVHRYRCAMIEEAYAGERAEFSFGTDQSSVLSRQTTTSCGNEVTRALVVNANFGSAASIMRPLYNWGLSANQPWIISHATSSSRLIPICPILTDVFNSDYGFIINFPRIESRVSRPMRESRIYNVSISVVVSRLLFRLWNVLRPVNAEILLIAINYYVTECRDNEARTRGCSY